MYLDRVDVKLDEQVSGYANTALSWPFGGRD